MTATHYRLSEEGGWFALVHGPRALLVEASAEQAAELWPAFVSGADALLDRLTAHGLSGAPSFAFGEADAQGRLRTILRGPVAATISAAASADDAPIERSGSGAATWRDDADAGASAVLLRRESVGSAGAELPLVSGVVRAGSLRLDLVAEGPVAGPPAQAPASAPAPRPEVDRQPFTVPPFAPVAAPSAAEPGAVTPVEPEQEQEPEVDDGIDERTTVLPPRRPSTVPEQTVLPEQTILPIQEAPAPAAENAAPSDAEGPVGDESAASPDQEAEDEYDYLFGSTVVRTVADAAVHDPGDGQDGGQEEQAEPDASTDVLEVPAAGDHDGHTIVAADLAELRARRRDGAEAAAPASAPAPALRLVRHDGVVESLDQPVLVGRAPSVSQVPGDRIPRLVTVNSLGQDISRNHVQFTVEGGTVVVTDLHSRNGTHIVLPGKSPQKLRQGEPTAVIAGTVVDLGGGVTFTVSED